MSIVVFEDSRVPYLYPITIGRPAFAISCGSFRLIDHVRSLGQPIRCVVRPHLWEILKADYSDTVAPPNSSEPPTMFVNARLVPSVSAGAQLRALWQAKQPGKIITGSGIAAAILPESVSAAETQLGVSTEDYLSRQPLPPLSGDLPLFEYPHDVIRYQTLTLADNLEQRIRRGKYQQLSDGVFLAEGATLGEYVVSDTREGPIVLEQNATVGPFSYLSGPAYLGRNSRVLEHAAIKDAVSLEHTTKVGGEVEASVIEPYSNKQHHGFLGHSYLGSWINLGAGTCNSDLKNTYGTVNMEYGGEKVSTGMQFVGCIMGDYSKSAINTGIFTGKTIGACSMVYGFVTTNVPSFVNYARLFGQITELPAEVMISTQARMFARRNVTQRPCDIQLMHAMYALTGRERQLAGEPLAL